MTASQPSAAAVDREAVGDRAQWEQLRAAAHRGHLQPEGDQLLQELHERHPEWRDEFL